MQSQLFVLIAALAAAVSGANIPAWATGVSHAPVPEGTGVPFVKHSPNFQAAAMNETGASGGATGGVVTTGAATTNTNVRDGVGKGVDTYKLYRGDGTTGRGWPAKSKWASFQDMFDNYRSIMASSCQQWGVPNNSPAEIQQIFNAIQTVAAQTKVDHRFILAVVMQESNGCVRVPPTQGFFLNPGLMQTANGQHMCNNGKGQVKTPCPNSEILGMIQDGAAGTPSGDGLAQSINRAGVSDVSAFYKAARFYNSGANSLPPNGDLSGGNGATLCYSSDIANRLTGWVHAPHGCSL